LVTVQLRDRLLRILVARHLNEGESTRTTGHTVSHHRHGLYLACLPEQRFEVLFHRLVRKIANEQFPAHVASPAFSWNASWTTA